MLTRQRIGRNDKCSCKSGKKFKKCCLLKQRPQMSPPSMEQMAAMQAAQQQSSHSRIIFEDRLKEFRQRFCREPGPADRIFFEQPTQQLVIEKITEAMTSAKIDPAFIYAFQKTGLLMASENMYFLTGEDLQKWQDAVDDYREQQKLLATVSTGEPHAE